MVDIERAIKGDKEAFSRVIMQNKEVMYKTTMIILKKMKMMLMMLYKMH